METFSALLAFVREFTGHRWIPAQRPVTRSFDVFFDLCLDIRLSKQSWGCDQVVADSNFKYVLEIKDVPKFKDART